MADLDQPIHVQYAGKELFSGKISRTMATQVKTLLGRGDPYLIFDAEVAVTLAEEKSAIDSSTESVDSD